MPDQAELVIIGKVIKPFGVHGKVHVQSLTDVPHRFEELQNAMLVTNAGNILETTVDHVQKSGKGYVVGFAAFTSPEEAGLYRGAWIKVPKGTRPSLPSNQYYQCELIGLEVWDETGRKLGTLEEVRALPHQHLFVVVQEGKEWLIPATRQVVKQINTEERRMTVAPIEEWGETNAL